MKYDFTSLLDRHGQDAMAVDAKHVYHTDLAATVKEGFDRIPMWVADMNFPTAPSIQRAVIERMQHPAFGYFQPRDAYYEAIQRWHASHDGLKDIPREAIGYENGVLGGVVSALRVFCQEGDNVLVHSPTYIGFTATLKNNGFNIVHSPLKVDGDGVWRMDYEDMERRIKAKNIHAAILCSPHNPCGRVWSREELETAMEIFRRNDVYVIADEIWSDLTMPGHHHIPAQSISEDARERTVALYAPSKTFNLAGLVGSYHIIFNKYIRDRVKKQSSLSHYNEMNVLSMHALIGAYSDEGAEWLEELRVVLDGNAKFACDYIEEHFDGVKAARPEGTYMLFIDCEEWCAAHDVSMDDLVEAGIEVGVNWQDGRYFGGSHTIRLNLASPLSRIEQAFERLDKYVFNK
ncbi:MAG: MalY/PatB family protein [Anaerovoracaceae bacterium]|jgi:cystathionine beta-lyase